MVGIIRHRRTLFKILSGVEICGSLDSFSRDCLEFPAGKEVYGSEHDR